MRCVISDGTGVKYKVGSHLVQPEVRKCSKLMEQRTSTGPTKGIKKSNKPKNSSRLWIKKEIFEIK